MDFLALAGQVLFPKLPEQAEWEAKGAGLALAERYEEAGFGGAIFFRGELERSPELLAELQADLSIPLLIASDLERGLGQQVVGATRFPMALSLGAARDPFWAHQVGAITGLEARMAGIHWIYAPTVDLVTRPDNPIINVRGLGAQPRAVARLAAAFVEGVQSQGALACAKHFPGHAETNVDSHDELPSLEVSRTRLEVNDWHPYRELIRLGLKSIMVGHLACPALDDSGAPASLSRRVVTDVLRGQMGFRGLIVTDAMDMGAIAKRHEPGEAAVRALMAGCDVILMPPEPERAKAAIVAALQEGRLSRSQLQASVERILDAKAAVGLFGGGAPEAAWPDRSMVLEDLARASVCLAHDDGQLLPLRPEQRLAAVVLDDDGDVEAVAQFRSLWAQVAPQAPVMVLGPEAPEAAVEEAAALAAGCEVVVVPAFMAVKAWKGRAHLPPHLAQVPGRLKAAGAKVLLLSFTSPFLREAAGAADALVLAWDAQPQHLRQALAASFGQGQFMGQAPVDWSWDQVTAPSP